MSTHEELTSEVEFEGTSITRMSLQPKFNKSGGIEIQYNDGMVQAVVEDENGESASMVFGVDEFATFTVGVLAILSEVNVVK